LLNNEHNSVDPRRQRPTAPFPDTSGLDSMKEDRLDKENQESVEMASFSFT
jgi:hypothetical protein